MVDIRAEIANALHWDPAIPSHKVAVEVDGGLVTLDGVVDRTYQKSYAEAIARRVAGVVDVRNKIAIRASVELSQRALHP
jgi:osmotically-inducible protein OsmY